MLDGASAMISQNRGAGEYRRTRELFWWLMLVDVMIGLIGFVAVSLWLDELAVVFARSKSGFDSTFCQMIVDIHRWEMLGYITLGIHSAVNSLMLGYEMGKSALTLNMARIFVFRIPVLWGLMRWTNMGSEAVGVMMMISNVATGVISLIAMVPVLKKIRRLEKET
jgi:Na+-driven multidrug efflux pump